MIRESVKRDALTPPATAFSAVAETYDATFSTTELGRLLRARTRTRLGRFQAGMTVLELGCGTGEDAIWLAQRGVRVLATDASEAMLKQTRTKAHHAGVADRVETRWLDLNAPSLDRRERFDGAFCNFGALNCVQNLQPLAQWLAGRLKPGARLVLVVMSPLCVWELGVYAVRREWLTAVRRWRRGGTIARVGGNLVRVFYPDARQVERTFAPHFKRTHLEAIGVLLPPPYLSGFAARHPQLIRVLAEWEKRMAAIFPFRALGDHYLIELVRR